MIKCQNCGADIEELVPRCPYCGAMNEPGAEHKYMQDLYKLKDDLEDLGEMPQEEISDEVKNSVTFEPVKTFKEVLAIALKYMPVPSAHGSVNNILKETDPRRGSVAQ